MKKRQILLLLLTTIIVVFCVFRKQISYELYRKASIFSAGSYPYAATYNLNYSESEVKQALMKLKILHPEYNVSEFEDHQTKNPAFWYITYFHLQGDNEVVNTFTRENGKSETTFAFVQIKQIKDDSWKEINRDFDYTENRTQIEKFEKRKLKELNSILKDKKAVGSTGFAE